ncbi:MAG: hypothetical protein LBO62_03205, partial [Endomicrobium sp.]|nr:hypothetical protein [Endomicrobium sp.]
GGLISQLNDVAVRQDAAAAAAKAKEIFPAILVSDISPQDHREAVSSLNDFLVSKGLMYSDASRYSPFATSTLRLDIIRDYVVSKKSKGENFDRAAWAAEASQKFMRQILLDILTQENTQLVYATRGNVVDFDGMQMRAAYLKRLSTAEGAQITQAERNILNAVDSRLRTYIEARDSEMPVIVSVLGEYNAEIKQMPASFRHLSRELQMLMMKDYYAHSLNQWLGNGMNASAINQNQIITSLYNKYKADIIFDLLAFETQKNSAANKYLIANLIKVLEQNAGRRIDSGLANQTGKKYGFVHYTDENMSAAVRFVDAVYNDKALSDEEKNNILQIALAGISSEAEKVDFVLRLFDDALGSQLSTADRARLRDYIRIVVHAQANYDFVATGRDGIDRRLGAVSLSGFTDFVNWSLNLTATADLKQIYEHLNAKAKAARDEEAIDRGVNQSIGNAVFEAIKQTLGSYLPDSFKLSDISTDLTNAIIASVRSAFGSDADSEIENKVQEILNNKSLTEEQKQAQIQAQINAVLVNRGLVDANEANPLVKFAIGVVNNWQSDVLLSALGTYSRDASISLSDFKVVAGKIYSGLKIVWENSDGERQKYIVNNFEDSLNTIKSMRKGSLSDAQWFNDYESYFRTQFAHSGNVDDTPQFPPSQEVPSETSDAEQLTNQDPNAQVSDAELVTLHDFILNNPYNLARFNEWYLGNQGNLADLTVTEQYNKIRAMLHIDTNADNSIDKHLSPNDAQKVFERQVQLYQAIRSGYGALFATKYGRDITDGSFGTETIRILNTLLFENGNLRSVSAAIRQLEFTVHLDALWNFLNANPARKALVNLWYNNALNNITNDAGKYEWLSTLLYLDINGDGSVDKQVSAQTARDTFQRQESLYNAIRNNTTRSNMFKTITGYDITSADSIKGVNLLLFESDGKMKDEARVLAELDHFASTYSAISAHCASLTNFWAVTLEKDGDIRYYNVQIIVNGQSYSTRVHPFKAAGIDTQIANNSKSILTMFAGLVRAGFIVNKSENMSEDTSDTFFKISKAGVNTSNGFPISMNIYPFVRGGQNVGIVETAIRTFNSIQGIIGAGYSIDRVIEENRITRYEVSKGGVNATLYPHKNGVSGPSGVKTVPELLKELQYAESLKGLRDEIKRRGLKDFYELMFGRSLDGTAQADIDALISLMDASGVSAYRQAVDNMAKVKTLYDNINALGRAGGSAMQSILGYGKLIPGIEYSQWPRSRGDHSAAYKALSDALFLASGAQSDILFITEIMKYANGRLSFGGNDSSRGFYLLVDGRADYKFFVYNRVGNNRLVNGHLAVPSAIQNVLELAAKKEMIKQIYTKMGYGSEIINALTFGRDLKMEIQLQDHSLGNSIYLVLPNGAIVFPFGAQGIISDKELANAIFASWLRDQAETGRLLGRQYGSMDVALSVDEATKGSMVFYYNSNGEFRGSRPGFGLHSIAVSVVKRLGGVMSAAEAKNAILNAGKLEKLKSDYVSFRRENGERNFELTDYFDGDNLYWSILNS